MAIRESKIKFDYSISTEDRFALRNWFNRLGLFLATQHGGSSANFFSPNFLAVGFSGGEFSQKEFLLFLGGLGGESGAFVRFPEFYFKSKTGQIFGQGTMECYSESMLTLEGTVEIKITKTEKMEFLATNLKFFPRLLVTKNNVEF